MFVDRVINCLTSLRLTVVCLGLAIVLVFWGTLAQVQVGLYQAQNEFFRSFFIFRQLPGSDFKIPVFPGGYLIGGVLFVNLLAAHAARFRFSWRKSGILLAHSGLVLLLLGQFGTDLMSTESAMRLTVGETRNYSEDFRANELVVVNTTNGIADEIVAIPESRVARRGEISDPRLAVQFRIRDHWPNCGLLERPPAQARPSGAIQGVLARSLVLPLPPGHATGLTRAAVLLEILSDRGTLGPWLVASRVEEAERFHLGGRQWRMSLEFVPERGGNLLFLTDSGRGPDEQPAPIGGRELMAGHEIAPARAPFKVRVRQFWPDCRVYREPSAAAVAPEITRGPFAGVVVEPLPPVTNPDDRNFSVAQVEVISPEGSLGTWLLPAAYRGRQGFTFGGATYELAFRPARYYQPFSITLLKATHQKYPGTEIPKDFRSRVRVQRDDTGEVRETEIYMNAPLRFAGLTFYQYQMAADEAALRAGERPTSTFQVVKNPTWPTPYISCGLVGAGLLVQFLMHLAGFITKRKPA